MCCAAVLGAFFAAVRDTAAVLHQDSGHVLQVGLAEAQKSNDIAGK